MMTGAPIRRRPSVPHHDRRHRRRRHRQQPPRSRLVPPRRVPPPRFLLPPLPTRSCLDSGPAPSPASVKGDRVALGPPHSPRDLAGAEGRPAAGGGAAPHCGRLYRASRHHCRGLAWEGRHRRPREAATQSAGSRPIRLLAAPHHPPPTPAQGRRLRLLLFLHRPTQPEAREAALPILHPPAGALIAAPTEEAGLPLQPPPLRLPLRPWPAAEARRRTAALRQDPSVALSAAAAGCSPASASPRLRVNSSSLSAEEGEARNMGEASDARSAPAGRGASLSPPGASRPARLAAGGPSATGPEVLAGPAPGSSRPAGSGAGCVVDT